MAVTPSQKTRIVGLVGPTAAGKSSLAVRLALLMNADIVTADSAQIYRYLNIGTAKPGPEERQSVRHHLIDLVEPDQQFSVANYQAAAYEVIADLESSGKPALLVGGSGLYVNAVIDGYAFEARGKNEQIRRRLQEEADQGGNQPLLRRLEKVDPRAAAGIHPADTRRIIRALEVYLQDGRPISEQVEKTGKGKPDFDLMMFGLTLPRQKLYARIRNRLDDMLGRGFLKEVEQVLEMGFSPQCPGLQNLGYRQLVSYLNGLFSWEETVENICRDTRRLAKRQLTWFRRDSRIRWLEYESDPELAWMAEYIWTQVKGNRPL